MDKIGDGLPPLPPLEPGQGKDKAVEGGGSSFGEILRAQLEEVNQMKLDADRAVEQLATGQRTDIDEVMIAVEKADLAFRALMEIRNKLVDAFEEINRMRIG